MRSAVALFWSETVLFALTLFLWLGLWQGLVPGDLRGVGATLFPFLLAALLILGLALLVQALRCRTELGRRWIRRGLILTGAASTATGAGIILHNLLDGLAGNAGGWDMMSSILKGLSIGLFFVGILAPAVFILAIHFTAALLLRRKGPPFPLT